MCACVCAHIHTYTKCYITSNFPSLSYYDYTIFSHHTCANYSLFALFPFQDPFLPSLPYPALYPRAWLCGHVIQAPLLAGLQLGSARGGTAGTLESWRERSQDLSFLLLLNFFPLWLQLLSWILVAQFLPLNPSALVLAELPPFFLFPGSLNIPSLFFPLTLSLILYILLSSKSPHLNYLSGICTNTILHPFG